MIPIRRRNVWLLPILFLVLFTVSWGLVVEGNRWLTVHSSPWFGRRPSNPKRISITVGPVDPVRGIPGVLTIGEEKARVVAQLGKPAVAESTLLKPLPFAIDMFDDASQKAGEFVSGAYAWVQYSFKQRVLSMTFDLEAYHTMYCAEQRVLLRVNNKEILLERGQDINEVMHLLDPTKTGKVKRQGSSLLLRGTGAALEFDLVGGLRSIYVSDWISK